MSKLSDYIKRTQKNPEAVETVEFKGLSFKTASNGSVRVGLCAGMKDGRTRWFNTFESTLDRMEIKSEELVEGAILEVGYDVKTADGRTFYNMKTCRCVKLPETREAEVCDMPF